MISLGIDIGSTTTKGVIIDKEYNILQSCITPTGSTPKQSAEKIICELTQNLSPSLIYATGYGRSLIDIADKKVTEITCHGAGVNALNPTARTIIDIGGQDSKAIHLAEKGKVADFAMNDKCAAGTGSFLDNIAHKFDLKYDQMLEMISRSSYKAKINSTCVVFAESEIIGLLAAGENMNNILAGVLKAIAVRIGRLFSQVNGSVDHPVFFTGGVARNTAMKYILEEELQTELIVNPYSQFMGAIGAAVMAQKDLT